jgi:hypothetical protein
LLIEDGMIVRGGKTICQGKQALLLYPEISFKTVAVKIYGTAMSTELLSGCWGSRHISSFKAAETAWLN